MKMVLSSVFFLGVHERGRQAFLPVLRLFSLPYEESPRGQPVSFSWQGLFFSLFHINGRGDLSPCHSSVRGSDLIEQDNKILLRDRVFLSFLFLPMEHFPFWSSSPITDRYIRISGGGSGSRLLFPFPVWWVLFPMIAR